MLSKSGPPYLKSLSDPTKLHQIIRAFTSIGMIFLGVEGVAVMIPAFFSARDLHQDYLMARALRDGINPYLPVTSLWEHYFGDRIYNGGLKHPSPHPPLVIILLLPFSFLPPPLAGLMWWAMSVLAMILAIRFIFPIREERRRYLLPTLALLATGVAGRFDLLLGQLNSLILALISLVWFGVTRNRYLLAGIALGGASSLKFFGWPLWLVLACHRKWRLCGVACVTFCVIQLGTLGMIGGEALKSYYKNAVPQAYARWGEAISNNSVQSLLVRMTRQYHYKWDNSGRFKTIEDVNAFSARGQQGLSSATTVDSPSPSPETRAIPTSEAIAEQYVASRTEAHHTPPTASSNLDRTSFILGMLLVIALSLLAASHNLATGFSRAVMLSCIASPLAWSHSFVPLILPMLLLVHSNVETNYPFKLSWLKTREGAILILLLAVLTIPFDLISWDLLALVSADRTRIGIVPWWIRTIHLIPTVTIVAVATLFKLPRDRKS